MIRCLHGYTQFANKQAAWHFYLLIFKSIIMGTIQKGILGGFSGKVGTVVSGRVQNISHTFSFFVTDDLLKFMNKKHNTKYKAKKFKKYKDLLLFVADK